MQPSDMFPMPLTPELSPVEVEAAGKKLFDLFATLPNTPVDITLTINVLDLVPRIIECHPLDDMERAVLGDKHRLTLVCRDLAGEQIQESVIAEIHPLVNGLDWNGDDVVEELVELSISQLAAASAAYMHTCFDSIGWDVSSFMVRATQVSLSPLSITLVLLARLAQFEMLKLIALAEHDGLGSDRIAEMMDVYWYVDSVNTHNIQRALASPDGTLTMETLDDQQRRAAGEWN